MIHDSLWYIYCCMLFWQGCTTSVQIVAGIVYNYGIAWLYCLLIAALSEFCAWCMLQMAA